MRCGMTRVHGPKTKQKKREKKKEKKRKEKRKEKKKKRKEKRKRYESQGLGCFVCRYIRPGSEKNNQIVF